jgi:hypothetical protein
MAIVHLESLHVHIVAMNKGSPVYLLLYESGVKIKILIKLFQW